MYITSHSTCSVNIEAIASKRLRRLVVRLRNSGRESHPRQPKACKARYPETYIRTPRSFRTKVARKPAPKAFSEIRKLGSWFASGCTRIMSGMAFRGHLAMKNNPPGFPIDLRLHSDVRKRYSTPRDRSRHPHGELATACRSSRSETGDGKSIWAAMEICRRRPRKAGRDQVETYWTSSSRCWRCGRLCVADRSTPAAFLRPEVVSHGASVSCILSVFAAA